MGVSCANWAYGCTTRNRNARPEGIAQGLGHAFMALEEAERRGLLPSFEDCVAYRGVLGSGAGERTPCNCPEAAFR